MPRKQIFKPNSNEEETILGIRITKEKRQILKLLAAKRRISMAELTRDIIDSFLNDNKKEIKKLDSE